MRHLVIDASGDNLLSVVEGASVAELGGLLYALRSQVDEGSGFGKDEIVSLGPVSNATRDAEVVASRDRPDPDTITGYEEPITELRSDATSLIAMGDYVLDPEAVPGDPPTDYPRLFPAIIYTPGVGPSQTLLGDGANGGWRGRFVEYVDFDGSVYRDFAPGARPSWHDSRTYTGVNAAADTTLDVLSSTVKPHRRATATAPDARGWDAHPAGIFILSEQIAEGATFPVPRPDDPKESRAVAAYDPAVPQISVWHATQAGQFLEIPGADWFGQSIWLFTRGGGVPLNRWRIDYMLDDRVLGTITDTRERQLMDPWSESMQAELYAAYTGPLSANGRPTSPRLWARLTDLDADEENPAALADVQVSLMPSDAAGGGGGGGGGVGSGTVRAYRSTEVNDSVFFSFYRQGDADFGGLIGPGFFEGGTFAYSGEMEDGDLLDLLLTDGASTAYAATVTFSNRSVPFRTQLADFASRAFFNSLTEFDQPSGAARMFLVYRRGSSQVSRNELLVPESASISGPLEPYPDEPPYESNATYRLQYLSNDDAIYEANPAPIATSPAQVGGGPFVSEKGQWTLGYLGSEYGIWHAKVDVKGRDSSTTDLAMTLHFTPAAGPLAPAIVGDWDDVRRRFTG